MSTKGDFEFPASFLAQDIEILQLADEASKSCQTVNTNCTGYMGRLFTWISKQKGELPEWVENHVKLTDKLQAMVDEAKDEGRDKELPKGVLEVLENCKKATRDLSEKVDVVKLAECLKPTDPKVDSSGLLKPEHGQAKLRESKFEWHLNLGLLMNVYKRTKDPTVKKQISFLVVNYLAKSASTNITQLGLDAKISKELENRFQFGIFPKFMTYHRESTTELERLILKQISGNFAQSSGYGGFITDTVSYDELLPVSFTVVNPVPKQKGDTVQTWGSQIASAVHEHFQRSKSIEEGYSEFLERPILFDFTDLLKELIVTNREDSKEKAFNSKTEELERKIDESIDRAIKILNEEHSDLFGTFDDVAIEKMRVFMRANIQNICRVEVKGKEVGIMKSIPLFAFKKYFDCPGTTKLLGVEDEDPEKMKQGLIRKSFGHQAENLVDFLNRTGIRIGGVSGRDKVFNFLSLEELISHASSTAMGEEQTELVDYSVRGRNIKYFENKDDITKTVLFRALEKKFTPTPDGESSEHSHYDALGKSTLDLLRGLLSEIPEDQWNRLNENPETRQILQTSLFRIQNHLASADFQMHDYTKFTQAIELVHCEIATILALTSPFKEGDFEKIYLGRLDHVPISLREMVSAGVTKSAMNTFAGINAAVLQTSPKIQSAYGPYSYFESVFLIGEKRSLDNISQDQEVDQVDLYVSEFNHNVTIDLTHDEYSRGKVIEEVEKLLSEKPETEHLTVAVDCTIDFINSEKAKELLEKFEDQIKAGKLNFVFFRSGQKFEMFGMDNYYGSPYYMVNNGSKHWAPFQMLKTNKAFKTDDLSQQWFCLANKYAPQALDDYRGIIFKNTEEVLKKIPEKLKPGNNSVLKVCTVAGGSDAMDPAFIDIKLISDDFAEIRFRLEKLFAEKFAERGLKFHSRGSFGFYHPNLNVIPALQDRKDRNVRINLGLNPEEVQIMIDIFNDIVTEIVEPRESSG